jgi:AcrR family transcriptional regulator
MPRMTAAARRVGVVRAAVQAFARTGYEATPVSAIAELAGVSQPYLFRLFGTKQDLFMIAADSCFAQLRVLLAKAADGLAGQAAVDAMRRACLALDAGDELLCFPMMLYAATHDPAIAKRADILLTELYNEIVNQAGVDDERTGLLLATLVLAQTTSVMEPCPEPLRRALHLVAGASASASASFATVPAPVAVCAATPVEAGSR